MHNVKYISLLFSTLNPTTISDSANNVRIHPLNQKQNNPSRVPGNTAHPITTAQVSTTEQVSTRGWRGSRSCCRSVYIYINSPSKKFSPQGASTTEESNPMEINVDSL